MTKYWDFLRDAMFAAIIVCLAPLASAQDVTLAVSPSSGERPVTPTATWSTTPAASSCVASGGWNGAKAASGSQVLPAITANTTYTLTCSFGTTGTATVNWTAPTTNTDGSALTDLAGFRVVYGTSANNLSNTRTVASPTASTTTITGLAGGTWHLGVIAYNTGGRESDLSNVASKTVASAVTRTASDTVTVTAPPTVPNPPSNTSVTISQVVFDVRKIGRETYLSRAVGTIALGKPCGAAINIPYQRGFRAINPTDVQFTKHATGTLVAQCS